MIFIDNKYYLLYRTIIERAKNRTLAPSEKKEIHHILPRSLGGTDDAENLVPLTLKEHWVCHKLLIKCLKDKVHTGKMRSALKIMAVKEFRITTGKKYELVRSNMEPWNKGLTGLPGTPCSDERRDYFRSLYTGKPRSEEDKQAMRDGWVKKYDEGHVVWNKGVKGTGKKEGIECSFISPTGEIFKYKTFKEGCESHGLHRSAMSKIKNTDKKHKGWSAKTLDK